MSGRRCRALAPLARPYGRAPSPRRKRALPSLFEFAER
jgi:hypothetical protein